MASLSDPPIYLPHPYRLRTPRQRRRALLEDRDKQLLALHKEQQHLRHQQKTLPWIPLDPPVIRGWKRSFVLRDDVARGPDAAMYERILERINTVQYSPRRDFKIKKRSKGRKIRLVHEHTLHSIASWEWNQCAFTPEEAAQFELTEDPPTRSHQKPTYRYVFREPWRYVLRGRLHIITQTRQRDEDLEARLHAINTYLERTNQRPRLDTLLDGHHQYRCRWKDESPRDLYYTQRRPFRNCPLHRVLLDD